MPQRTAQNIQTAT